MRRDRRGRYAAAPIDRVNKKLWRANKRAWRWIFWRVF